MAGVNDAGAISNRDARLALFFALVGGAAVLAVIPYALALIPGARERIASSHVPAPGLFAAQFVQSVVMLFILSWIGLRLGRTVQLDSPLARAWVYRMPAGELPGRTLALSAVLGLVAGLLVLGADKLLFMPAMPPALHPTDFQIARWKCLLASFYGGIVEELLCRLFLLTFVAWAIWKVASNGRPKPGLIVYGSAALIATLLFAAGHLPAARQIWPLEPVVITRAMTLNGLLGLIFGGLYCRWGLEHAMLAHFTTDLAIHVIGGG